MSHQRATVGWRATLVFAIAIVAAGSNLKGADGPKPLRALLITGGCCHNYALQRDALTNAVAQLGPVTWQVVQEGGNGTRAEISLYNDANWANGFDVIVHNECFADTKSPEYIRRITDAHRKGVPAVVIHCAMHTYRATDIDDWREFLGVTSRRHDHLSRYPVVRVDKTHPILEGFPEKWTTPADELYVIEKVWPRTRPLATAKSEQDGKDYPVIWVHQFGGTRVFGTTFGHSDETFRDPVFLKYVARGVVWAAGRLPR
jgi:type 1 glutamine amidotransferase